MSSITETIRRQNVVVIIGLINCPYCEWSIELMKVKNIPFVFFPVDWKDKNAARKEACMAISSSPKNWTFPIVFANGSYIGGYSDLKLAVEMIEATVDQGCPTTNAALQICKIMKNQTAET